MEGKTRFFLESNIELVDETPDLRKEVSSIIDLPAEKDRQLDLQYFSAIFVSSGENLNHAFFLPSELVAARSTIAAKALDVEHEENEIIGHLYDYAFMTKDGQKLDHNELARREKASLDTTEMHVVVAGVIYKNRFPQISKEVADGKWKVSMECYFSDYDVKVGELILSQREAEMLGFAHDEESFMGQLGKVVKDGIEIASGTITRVLKHVMFSGCGIVKNPANPPSVILETAHEKKIKDDDKNEVIMFDYDKLATANNVTSEDNEDSTYKENEKKKDKEDSALVDNDTVGICVSYKKEVINSTFKDPNSKVLHTNWCALFEKSCTSFSRDTTDPKCLRNIALVQAEACIKERINHKESSDKRSGLVDGLQNLIKKAKNLIDY